MRIGVFDPVFESSGLEAMLDEVVRLGIAAVELGAGGFPGNLHLPIDEILGTRGAASRYLARFEARGLIVSALSCHGNPLHPDADRANGDDAVFRTAVVLAERLGVGRVNLFSGCPGDGPGASKPNWVTSTWPPDFAELLSWQWLEIAVPYWSQAVAYAGDHGVRLGIEMHPGMLVYSPPTFQRLREAVGGDLGVNFDPSHLFWQGIDPIVAVHALGDAIVHVHAKDTAIDPIATAINGVLDQTPKQAGPRSWEFRSVGDGHDLGWWRSFIDALRSVGYDHVLSIEHEDRHRSRADGLRRAVSTLQLALATGPTAR